MVTNPVHNPCGGHPCLDFVNTVDYCRQGLDLVPDGPTAGGKTALAIAGATGLIWGLFYLLAWVAAGFRADF